MVVEVSDQQEDPAITSIRRGESLIEGPPQALAVQSLGHPGHRQSTGQLSGTDLQRGCVEPVH